MGASKVIAIDWDNQNEFSEETRRRYCLGKDNNIVEEILSNTNGRGVDNSCEFSGSPRTFQCNKKH